MPKQPTKTLARKEIDVVYDNLLVNAQQLVFDAIEAFCRKHKAECITNGPFGTMLTKYSRVYRAGYSLSHQKEADRQYCKDLEVPKHLDELMDWYTEKFGQIPQAICRRGVWS